MMNAVGAVFAVFVVIVRWRRRGDSLRRMRHSTRRHRRDRRRRILWHILHAWIRETVLARGLSRTHPYLADRCPCHPGGRQGTRHYYSLAYWNLGTSKQAHFFIGHSFSNNLKIDLQELRKKT